jgi:hypothetical protein
MGILGDSRAEMIKKLQGEVAKWQPQILPRQQSCFTLYCSNSRGAPGRDNMYRMRMPFKQSIQVGKTHRCFGFLDIKWRTVPLKQK